MSKFAIALVAVSGLAAAVQADITTSVSAVNNSSSPELAGFNTWDLGANTGTADWTQAQMVITLSTGTIYMHALNGGFQAPNPALIGIFPAIAFTSYITDGSSATVSVAGGAVNLGGAPAASFNSTGANVAWFTTNLNDFGQRTLARLSLSSNATGTWQLQVRAAGETPVTVGGVITNGVIPTPAAASVLALGGLVASRRRRA